MFITFAYGSQTGAAKSIAEELDEEARTRQYSSEIIELNQLRKVDWTERGVLVVVCSTTGNGDPPDNAEHFWRWIRRRTQPKDLLDGVSFATLALGDTNYSKFCLAGQNIYRRMRELGARPFHLLGLADEAMGLESVVEPWISGLWDALQVLENASEEYSIDDPDSVLTTDGVVAGAHGKKTKPVREGMEPNESKISEHHKVSEPMHRNNIKSAADVNTELSTKMSNTQVSDIGNGLNALPNEPGIRSEQQNDTILATDTTQQQPHTPMTTIPSATLQTPLSNGNGINDDATVTTSQGTSVSVMSAVDASHTFTSGAACGATMLQQIMQKRQQQSHLSTNAHKTSNSLHSQEVRERRKGVHSREGEGEKPPSAPLAPCVFAPEREKHLGSTDLTPYVKSLSEILQTTQDPASFLNLENDTALMKQANRARSMPSILRVELNQMIHKDMTHSLGSYMCDPKEAQMLSFLKHHQAHDTNAGPLGIEGRPPAGTTGTSYEVPFIANISRARYLTSGGPTAERRVVELTLDVSNWPQCGWIPGDALGVAIPNPRGLVRAIARRLGYNPDGRIRLCVESSATAAPKTSSNVPKTSGAETTEHKTTAKLNSNSTEIQTNADGKEMQNGSPNKSVPNQSKNDVIVGPDGRVRRRINLSNRKLPGKAKLPGKTAASSNKPSSKLATDSVQSNGGYQSQTSSTFLILQRFVHALRGIPNVSFEQSKENPKECCAISTSIETLLAWTVDLCAPPRRPLLKLLSQSAQSTNERNLLLYLASPAGAVYAEALFEAQRVHLLDVLAMFPSCQPELTPLLTTLPQLSPRLYSLTTSPLENKNEMKFAFTILTYRCEVSSPVQADRKSNGSLGKHGTTISSTTDMHPLNLPNSTAMAIRTEAASDAPSDSIVRYGLATHYLEQLTQAFGLLERPKARIWELDKLGESDVPFLRVHLRPTRDFMLPGSLKWPLILIGPGTGIAPFLGFLQHRRAKIQAALAARSAICTGNWRDGIPISGLIDEDADELGVQTFSEEAEEQLAMTQFAPDAVTEDLAALPVAAAGDVHLFFGNRSPHVDYLFENELKELSEERVLTRLYLAWSRHGPRKTYVQHRMRQPSTASEIARLITRENAYVYVCGDGTKMASDVRATLAKILRVYGDLDSEEAANAYLVNLEAKKRFLQDVWT